MTDNEQVLEIIGRAGCPAHGNYDCSPLLNGCNWPTWAKNLSAALSVLTEPAVVTGAEAVRRERDRQRSKGYTEEHDDNHNPRNLVKAGHAFASGNSTWWPWDKRGFHPRETIWNLVRAGAMYLAAEQFTERHGYDWGDDQSPTTLRLAVEARLDRLFKEAAAYLTPRPEPRVTVDREAVAKVIDQKIGSLFQGETRVLVCQEIADAILALVEQNGAGQ